MENEGKLDLQSRQADLKSGLLVMLSPGKEVREATNYRIHFPGDTKSPPESESNFLAGVKGEE